MARPKKQGSSYFPLDCDFMLDEKVVPIKVRMGTQGIAALIALMCAVYRNGYYLEWSERLTMKIANDISTTPEVVEETITLLIKYGFFDRQMAQEQQILTSKGIQRRYLAIKKGRIDTSTIPHWLIVDDKTPIMDDRNPVSVAKTPSNKIKEKEIKNKKHNLMGLSQKEPSGSIQAPPPREEVVKNFSLDDVKSLALIPEVAALRPLPADCEEFHSYYAARGWMIAPGIPIGSYKDALISWLHKRDRFNRQRVGSPSPTLTPPPRRAKELVKETDNPVRGDELDNLLKKYGWSPSCHALTLPDE